ncbi:MAG: UDP-glucuronic acid decarboxylase family protein [Rectinemataceae bacterium]
MRALVAGAAGFLGSHLCDRLVAEGFEVLAVDNLYTGRRKNLCHLEGVRGFSFLERDITRPIEPAAAGSLDLIFNLACPASPPHYQRDPIFTLDTNYLGTKNLLELAASKKARILQASTSEVYGDPAVHPQREDYWGNVNCFGPRSCYDEGKRIAETLMLEYARKYGIEIKVVRIFNTYGPRMDPDDGRIVSNFIVQALKGRPMTIYGDGSQTRSFCYVDDLVEGFLRMARSEPSLTGPINIGNPGEFTVREAAEIVKELTASPSEIVYRPSPGDDPKRRKPEIGLAVSRLGWRPEVPFREGLLRAIEYFRDPDAWSPKVSGRRGTGF